jgi:hypothetical protein
MEVYKFETLDNGDVLLKKVVLDNTNFTVVNKSNGDKVLKKITSVNISDIKDIRKFDFKKSNIMSCQLNNDTTVKLKFRTILENVYKIINDGATIIKNSKLNIKTCKKHDDGFTYLEYLGISVQGVDSNKCLLEIINQCVENEISLNMVIKLFNETTIHINF